MSKRIELFAIVLAVLIFFARMSDCVHRVSVQIATHHLLAQGVFISLNCLHSRRKYLSSKHVVIAWMR
jgi:hypothetical protein